MLKEIPRIEDEKEKEKDPSVARDYATYHKLSSLICGLKPSNTIIVSDMTGTLLHQTESGFPESERTLIKQLLDEGASLVLVTGDALQTVKDTFLERLDYSGPGIILLVTGSGYQITSVENGTNELIFRGKEIDINDRKQLLSVIEDLIQSHCDKDFHFTDTQKSVFFHGEGKRLDLKEQLDGRSSRFLVEIVPNKVNIYFPDSPRSEEKDSELLVLLESHPTVQEIAEEKGLHVVRGPNFVDIISSRKEEGLAALLNLAQGVALQSSRRNIVTLGDSMNDEGILCFNWESSGQIVKVFVGDDDEFVAKMNPNGSPNLIYLKGEYIDGTQLLMQLLARHI